MSKESGFTLLEVIIAFAILGLSVVAIYEALGSSTARSSRLQQRAPALSLVESLIAAQSIEPKYEPSLLHGRDGEYRWTITVTPEPDPKNAPGSPKVVRIDAVVQWGAASSAQEFRLQRLAFARPVEMRQ